ncbi:MAG: hypothetical protein ABR593_05015 [Candidatus Limnocylindria bacterium]
MLPLPVRLAFGMDALLVALHLANALPIPPLASPTLLFDLGVEGNLPTWWASTQLWTAAALLGFGARRRGGHPASYAMAALIGAFSLDEVSRLHERLGAATRSELLPVTGLWPVLLAPAALLVLGVSGWLARSTWRRDPAGAVWLGGGILGLLVSAAGIEMIVNFLSLGGDAHFAQVLVEEAGELISGTLILAGAYRFAVPPASVGAAVGTRSDG